MILAVWRIGSWEFAQILFIPKRPERFWLPQDILEDVASVRLMCRERGQDLSSALFEKLSNAGSG